MSAIAVRFAESAVLDLEVIKRWYAEQNVPEVGDRLVAEIFERIEALRDHPEMGRMVAEFGQMFLRELIQPPFRVVYRHEQRTVLIVRVWRSEQQLLLPQAQGD